MLPADPAFRSTFASCADWLSRAAALAQAPASPAGQQGPTSAADVPLVWSWSAAGPPATSARPDAGQDEAAEPPLPGPDQEEGFAAPIKPLFRPRDPAAITFAFARVS